MGKAGIKPAFVNRLLSFANDLVGPPGIEYISINFGG
jgi:hypothetical protein